MRHCIRLSQNEVKALADSLQFLSRKQQGSIERSYNIRLAGSTPTSDTNSEKQTVSEDKYRQHMRGLLGDIILEYVSHDTTVSPYDFISDIRTELYGLQDYFQDNLNRVNAILAYLDGQQSPHLFHRNKPNGH